MQTKIVDGLEALKDFHPILDFLTTVFSFDLAEFAATVQESSADILVKITNFFNDLKNAIKELPVEIAEWMDKSIDDFIALLEKVDATAFRKFRSAGTAWRKRTIGYLETVYSRSPYSLSSTTALHSRKRERSLR